MSIDKRNEPGGCTRASCPYFYDDDDACQVGLTNCRWDEERKERAGDEAYDRKRDDEMTEGK
jgi:hypothetical protein